MTSPGKCPHPHSKQNVFFIFNEFYNDGNNYLIRFISVDGNIDLSSDQEVRLYAIGTKKASTPISTKELHATSKKWNSYWKVSMIQRIEIIFRCMFTMVKMRNMFLEMKIKNTHRDFHADCLLRT